MADTITLAVPDELLQQARAEAALTNRPLDAVLLDWLRRGAPPADPAYMIYTPMGLEGAVQPLLDALSADTPPNRVTET